jgi:hypothetical protein
VTDPNVETEVGIESIENLIDRIDAKHRDAEAEEPTGQSDTPAAPAEPNVAVAEPQSQPAADWREFVLPDDVPHGFFKGKKLPQVFESISHAERAKQEAERERNEYKRQLEELQRAQAPQASQHDPKARIAEHFYEDPAQVADGFEELASRVYEQRRAVERQQEAETERVTTSHRALTAVAEQVMKDYGWDAQRAERAVVSTMPHLKAMYERDGVSDAWTNPNYAYNIVREIVGAPQPATPAIQAPPVPELSDPPGSGRPASAVPNVKPSALSTERAKAYEAVAKIAGLDPERLKARGARH